MPTRPVTSALVPALTGGGGICATAMRAHERANAAAKRQWMARLARDNGASWAGRGSSRRTRRTGAGGALLEVQLHGAVDRDTGAAGTVGLSVGREQRLVLCQHDL